jgi:hypothetical protein
LFEYLSVDGIESLREVRNVNEAKIPLERYVFIVSVARETGSGEIRPQVQSFVSHTLSACNMH